MNHGLQTFLIRLYYAWLGFVARHRLPRGTVSYAALLILIGAAFVFLVLVLEFGL